jgi:ribosomal protein L29
MKKKQKADLRSKTIAELRAMLNDEKKDLFSLSLEREQHILKDERSVFRKRKLIAVIQTFITEKETLNEEIA